VCLFAGCSYRWAVQALPTSAWPHHHGVELPPRVTLSSECACSPAVLPACLLLPVCLRRWEALEHVLQTAIEVAGDMSDYRQRWKEGRWWWWLGAGGRLQQAGPGRFTHMRCPPELAAGSSDSSSSGRRSGDSRGEFKR